MHLTPMTYRIAIPREKRYATITRTDYSQRRGVFEESLVWIEVETKAKEVCKFIVLSDWFSLPTTMVSQRNDVDW